MKEVVYIELVGAGNAKTGIKCDIHTTTFDELKKLIKIEFPVALANVDAPSLVIKDSLGYIFPISQTVDHAINRGLGESDASPILVEVPSLVHLAGTLTSSPHTLLAVPSSLLLSVSSCLDTGNN